jgi:hypothetical protein
MRGLILFSAIVFITNCKKEKNLSQLTEKNKDAEAERHGGSDDCRITEYHVYDPTHDYEQIDQYTYNKGLVDEWTTSYGTIYKMEYDQDKKMKIARAYVDGELIYTIKFVRKDNKIVKEIWYTGNTDVIDDEVINTYNKKGQLIKNESLNYDYYTINTYTSEGNLKSWFVYSGGLPNSKGEYTFEENVKEPYRYARPGIEYSFAYSNSAFGSGYRWYNSEKIILFDENSQPYDYYVLDPKLTKWQKGDQNLPVQADYIDKLSGGTIINAFKYENCISCHDFNFSNSRRNNLNNDKIGSKQGLHSKKLLKIAIL